MSFLLMTNHICVLVGLFKKKTAISKTADIFLFFQSQQQLPQPIAQVIKFHRSVSASSHVVSSRFISIGLEDAVFI